MSSVCNRNGAVHDSDKAIATKVRRYCESGSRIPTSLQAVFLASSRGKEVNLTPSDGSASRIFLRRFVLGRKATSAAALASSKKSTGSSAGNNSLSATDSSASNLSSSVPSTLESTCRAENTDKRALDESLPSEHVSGASSTHRCKDNLVIYAQRTCGDRKDAIFGGSKHGVSALSSSSHHGHRRTTSCCSTISSSESSTATTSSIVKGLTKATTMVHVTPFGEKGGVEQSSALIAALRSNQRKFSREDLAKSSHSARRHRKQRDHKKKSTVRSLSPCVRHSSMRSDLGKDSGHHVRKTNQNGLVIPTLSPQAYLDAMIEARGYSTTRYSALNTAYYNKPTVLQQASYHPHLIALATSGNIKQLRKMMESGISLNPCNSHRESFVHLLCRKGLHECLRILVELGSDLRVSDHYGRTPLHAACWTARPCFKVVDLIVRADRRLFYMRDCRGSLPLGYVRAENWAAWLEYLQSRKNIFWPHRGPAGAPRSEKHPEGPPELVQLDANTRISPDPPMALTPEVAALVASGKIEPCEANLLRYELTEFAENDDDDYEEDESSTCDDDLDELLSESGFFAQLTHLRVKAQLEMAAQNQDASDTTRSAHQTVLPRDRHSVFVALPEMAARHCLSVSSNSVETQEICPRLNLNDVNTPNVSTGSESDEQWGCRVSL